MIPRFSYEDAGARAYFDEHGFVVIRDALTQRDLATVESAWRTLVALAAGHCSWDPGEFAQRFPQHRDLWRKSLDFDRLLRQTPQAKIAAKMLGVRGVRLFHDHAICKPSGRSSTIPWHQDSAYWPLDRVGISLWTPTSDVPVDGGCLKILDGSHRDGPAAPQDFLAAPSIDRDRDPRLLRVPVFRGETVVLGGLTWHGSDPNQAATDRLAYLTLWVPSTARVVSEHGSWHPTASKFHGAPGDRLAGEWFPLFGEVPEADEGLHVRFPLPPPSEGQSMFTAGRDIAEQIAWLLQVERRPLREMLTPQHRGAFAKLVVAAGLLEESEIPKVETVLDELLLNELVREQSTARDVYLSAVSAWWSLLGTRIKELRHDH